MAKPKVDKKSAAQSAQVVDAGPAAPDKPEETPERAEMKSLLMRVRDRYKVMTEADQENRKKAVEDLKFAHEPGAQWDAALKKERGDRPCYEFNKLRITIKRVINHIRANRPAGKVRAVEDGDKDTADIYEGQIRNIWNVSDGDTVIDYEAEYVVAAGMGAWRVTTEYSDDTVFEQDVFIRAIKNPFCLYADPGASDSLKRDAEDWILTEKISNQSYESRWPKAKRSSFDGSDFDDDDDWEDGESTRICEYWYKKPYKKTLYLLPDGKTVDALPDGVTPVKEREVNCKKIYMVIVSGDSVLEGPKEWAGSMFPFVQVHGEWRVIDGKVQWHGLTRFSKDAQRAYNASRTAIAETIALAPTAKHWMTPKQFEGLGDHIAEAHKKNIPVSFYNPDPGAPGAPQRTGGADVPVALIQEAGMASEDIKATSGIFDASLGNQSNETSGVAIRSRQQQGEIATYNFPDNISKGIRRTYEILIDLIPKIYDTSRSLRILGADGAEKYVRVNNPVQQQDGSVVTENDLTAGKYDVTVTSGPSFSTQRQEAAEVYTQIGQAVPALWGVAGDLVVKAMDLPYSEQIADRMRTLLPPQIQQQMNQDKPVPPEVQAVMQQAEQAMQVVQHQSQLVLKAEQEAKEQQADADKASSEIDQKVAEFKTLVAQFEASVAKDMAAISMKQADLKVMEAQLGSHESDLAAREQTVQSQTSGVDAIAQQSALAVASMQALLQQIGTMSEGILQLAQKQPPKVSRSLNAKRDPATGGLSFKVDDVDETGQVLNSRAGTVSRQPTGDLLGQMS